MCTVAEKVRSSLHGRANENADKKSCHPFAYPYRPPRPTATGGGKTTAIAKTRQPNTSATTHPLPALDFSVAPGIVLFLQRWCVFCSCRRETLTRQGHPPAPMMWCAKPKPPASRHDETRGRVFSSYRCGCEPAFSFLSLYGRHPRSRSLPTKSTTTIDRPPDCLAYVGISLSLHRTTQTASQRTDLFAVQPQEATNTYSSSTPTLGTCQALTDKYLSCFRVVSTTVNRATHSIFAVSRTVPNVSRGKRPQRTYIIPQAKKKKKKKTASLESSLFEEPPTGTIFAAATNQQQTAGIILPPRP